MRYEVQQSIDELNKALGIIGMMKIPNMKPPTDEELEFALNKGLSCMTLMMRILSKKDMTMKELNENLCKKETIEKERVTTNIEIPDEISR